MCAFSEATQRGSLFDSLVFSRRQYLHAIVMFPKYEVQVKCVVSCRHWTGRRRVLQRERSARG